VYHSAGIARILPGKQVDEVQVRVKTLLSLDAVQLADSYADANYRRKSREPRGQTGHGVPIAISQMPESS